MDIQSFLVGIGFGGVVSAWATHHFTVSRMAIADKNDFRGYLGRWIGAMKQMNGSDELQIRRIYFEYVPHLPGYAGKLDKTFVWRGRFRALCRSLGDIKAEDINCQNGDCRILVASRIEALIDFV